MKKGIFISIVALSALATGPALAVSANQVGEFDLWYEKGAADARNSIISKCASQGYFETGILVYKCEQLFVVE